MKAVRFTGISLAIGAVALLAGCVGVPTGPAYSNGVYDSYGGYGGYGGGYGGGYVGGGYSAPYYADPAPVVVVPPPVYIQGGGGYYGRPGYDQRWRGHNATRPGWGQRPGYVPGVVPRPGVAPPRSGVAPRVPGMAPSRAAPGVYISPNEAARESSREQRRQQFGAPAPSTDRP